MGRMPVESFDIAAKAIPFFSDYQTGLHRTVAAVRSRKGVT
jgi:hypothetical protein